MFALTFFVFAYAFPGEADWVFEETGIYYKLKKEFVTVNDAGETFILNFKEVRIIKISADGKKLLEFGRRGKGPGELAFPGGIMSHNNFLYAFDPMSRKLMTFDKEGTYIGQHIFTERYFQVAHTNGGLIGTQKSLRGDNAGEEKLWWIEPDTQEPKILSHLIPRIEKGKAPKFEKNFIGLPYNPARDKIRFGVSNTTHKFVVVHPGTHQKITIHDSETGEILKTLSQKNDPLPFNKTWGEQKFENIRQREKEAKRNSRTTVESFSDFPVFFPFARRLWVFEDGHFYVLLWKSKPDDNPEIWGFNMEGERIEHTLTHGLLSDVVHMTPTHAWISIFDPEEEEVGIAKVTRSNLGAFYQSHILPQRYAKDPGP